MGPTSSTDAFDEAARRTLLDLARASIREGLARQRALEVDPSRYPPRLQERKGCFVTLHLAGELRGCVGALHARAPLVSEVARTAFSAAFRDPRFPPLTADEAPRLDIHISVLSPPSPLHFESELDLLRQLRPGLDGLILRDGASHGTFLPEVWDRFSTPRDFLRQLRIKAGLPPDHWSPQLSVERYTTESWGDSPGH